MSRGLNTSYSSSMYNQQMKPLDYLYGPWESIDQMLDELDVQDDKIESGLTVAIVEGDKVVEYWNPIPGVGFFKKTPGGTLCDIVETYEDAKKYADEPKNVLNLVFVKNATDTNRAIYTPDDEKVNIDPDGEHDCVKPEKCVTEWDKYTLQEGTGNPREDRSGLYYVESLGNLQYIASDIWYGVFPEDPNEIMTSDRVEPIAVDGAAKVSDVYRMFKKEQLHVRKRLGHLEHHVHWMVEDLDTEEKRHTFVSAVKQEVDDKDGQRIGKIGIAHTNLETKEVLMSGCDEVGTSKGDETFIDIFGVNIGGYKNGDVIKNGDSLETVLKTMFDGELIPSQEGNEEPTVELTSVPDGLIAGEKDDEIIYEVGTIFNAELKGEYTDGKIRTFDIGETTNDGHLEDAGCAVERQDYYVMKPGSDDFETTNPNFNESLVEGDYSFKFEVTYSNSKIPRSNKGTQLPDLVIPGKTIEDVKSFKVRYKFWCGKSDVSNNPTTMTLDGFEERWLDKNTTFEKRIKLNRSEGYYVYAPADCDVIFDATGCGDVYPVLAMKEDGEVFEHTHNLPDGTEVKYRLWYMFNVGTYFNLRVVTTD